MSYAIVVSSAVFSWLISAENKAASRCSSCVDSRVAVVAAAAQPVITELLAFFVCCRVGCCCWACVAWCLSC